MPRFNPRRQIDQLAAEAARALAERRDAVRLAAQFFAGFSYGWVVWCIGGLILLLLALRLFSPMLS